MATTIVRDEQVKLRFTADGSPGSEMLAGLTPRVASARLEINGVLVLTVAELRDLEAFIKAVADEVDAKKVV